MKQRPLERLLARLAVFVATAPCAAGCSDSSGADSEGSGGGSGTGGGASGGGASGGSDGGAMEPVRIEGCTRTEFTACEPQTLLVDSSCIDAAGPSNEQCDALCGFYPAICSAGDRSADTATITCSAPCAVGRKPAGYVPSMLGHADLGEYFARAAELEGASVVAFRELRAELKRAGAPRSLLRRVSRAARDEVRHERRVRGLARRYGGSLRPLRITKTSARSLEALAVDNAVEGCVRETFGALIAHYQARAALDPEVRAAFGRIARDETRHAALSWSIQRWLEPRLGRELSRRVRAAQSAAARALANELRSERALADRALAGLPAPSRALELFGRLDDALWRSATG